MSKKKKKKVKKITHEIKLKIAIPMDLVELDGYKKGGGKKWKPRTGFPYWMFNSKGKIENKNYILDEHTDFKELANYLSREQILILK